VVDQANWVVVQAFCLVDEAFWVVDEAKSLVLFVQSNNIRLFA
jgi:hypothetical protein